MGDPFSIVIDAKIDETIGCRFCFGRLQFPLQSRRGHLLRIQNVFSSLIKVLVGNYYPIFILKNYFYVFIDMTHEDSYLHGNGLYITQMYE